MEGRDPLVSALASEAGELPAPIPPFAPVVPARQRFVQRAACDGLRLGLVVPYADGVAEAMRELGASWAPFRRMWVCELAGARRLLQGLKARAGRWPAHTLADARQTALAAWQQPSPDYFTALLDVQLLPLARGGFAVSSAFDPLVGKALRGLGGRFHRHARAWEVKAPREAILAALRAVAGVAQEFVFQHDGQGVLEDLVAPPPSELPISVAGAPPVATGGAMPNGTEAMGVGFLSAFGTALQADRKSVG